MTRIHASRRSALAALAAALGALPRVATALDVSPIARDLPFAPRALAVAGRDLAVGGESGLWVLGPGTGPLMRAPWPGSDAAIEALAVSDRFIAMTGPFGLRTIDRVERRVVADVAGVGPISAIALAADGAVIATDRSAGHLLRFDRDRVSLMAGGLRRPVGVFVDGDTDAWVTEYAAGRVTYVNLKSGAVRPLVFALNGPTAVAKLNTGNLAVMEPNFGRVLTVDPKTGERTPLAGGLALGLDDLDLPPDTAGGLAVTDKDVIYAACPGDRSIARIVPELRREKDKT